jgi:MoxR-like ATPase
MATSRYQHSDQLQSEEQVILDLVRLGLAGDGPSIKQLGRKLLRRRKDADHTEAFRENLGRMLLMEPDTSALRQVAPPMPIEPESKLPLAFVDDAPTTERPVLDASAASTLKSLLAERHAATRLLDAGLEPPKTLLLSGPPGVGKSMTARYLASELGLPLLTVELAALMSSFLGKTGQNLRQLLDHARQSPCVLLLDEFDAVAKRRDDETDIGELKRLVNVLLLELERWPHTGLLVAATNHPQLLDPAVGRRFDIRLDLRLPDQTARVQILRDACDRAGLGLDDVLLPAVALALDGASGADLTQVVARAARGAIVNETPHEQALAELALDSLRNGSADTVEARAAFCATAIDVLGMSQREIAKVLGITHPTVAKLAAGWRSDSVSAASERPAA